MTISARHTRPHTHGSFHVPRPVRLAAWCGAGCILCELKTIRAHMCAGLREVLWIERAIVIRWFIALWWARFCRLGSSAVCVCMLSQVLLSRREGTITASGVSPAGVGHACLSPILTRLPVYLSWTGLPAPHLKIWQRYVTPLFWHLCFAGWLLEYRLHGNWNLSCLMGVEYIRSRHVNVELTLGVALYQNWSWS